MAQKPTAARKRPQTARMGQSSSRGAQTRQNGLALACTGVPNGSAPGYSAVAAGMSLVDPFPPEGSGSLDTVPVFSASSIMFERLSFIQPIRNLTPDRIVAMNDAQEAGFLFHALRMWTSMARRGGMIFGLKEKRENAVVQRSWSTLQTNAVTDDPSLKPEAIAQKKWLNYFWNNMTCSCAWDRNINGGFEVFARLLMAAQSFRYLALHFVWKPSPKGLTAHIEVVPGWFFENVTGMLRFLGTTPTATYGTELDPTNWLTVCGSGLMEPASNLYALEQLGWNTLAQYCDRYGMPFPLGKTNAPKNSTEWQQMEAAVRGMRRDKGAVIGMGGAIELLAAAGTGAGPSESLTALCHRVLGVLFRGGDLDALSSTKGQGTGSNAQDAGSLLIEAADCQFITQTMQKIDRKVIDWNEEGALYLAFTQVKGPNLQDTKQEMEVDQMGINNGVRIPVSDWCDRYNRREADPGEPTLIPAPPKAPIDPALEGAPGALNSTTGRPPVAAPVREAQIEDLQALRTHIAEALQGLQNGADLVLKWEIICDQIFASDHLENALAAQQMRSALIALPLSPADADALLAEATANP